MNSILILFLVIIIIIAIWWAAVYFNPDYLIRGSEKLNTGSSPQTSIETKKLDNPGSSRYYYEGWFFIIGNQKVAQDNVLFNRGGDFVVALQGSTLNIYINASDDKVNSTTGSFNPSGTTKLTSIPNFPFQKWAQLVINVDGLSVDIYVDGRFVKNVLSKTVISSNANKPITYGNKYTLGNVARFRRPAESINPQGVWNHYMMGSGQNQSLTNYHLNAIITKHQRPTVDQRLF